MVEVLVEGAGGGSGFVSYFGDVGTPFHVLGEVYSQVWIAKSTLEDSVAQCVVVFHT